MGAQSFSGCTINGVVADPANASNNVLSITKSDMSLTFAGVATAGTPGLIDLTTDHDICVDFYEPDATGTLLIKLESSSNGGPEWEAQVNTTMGWNNYCVNTNSAPVAAGYIYQKLVIFPDFGEENSDDTYYLDNVYVNPISCDLILNAGTAICNANTYGTDTYDATFNFSQTTAPGAGTYTTTTTSGGTISGDDPNTMISGTIMITGISEGTNADLNVTNGANCDLDALLSAPLCAPPFDITFQVNMIEEISAGSFNPATQSVFVTSGTANQTGHYASCGLVMTDMDGDKVYEITQTYPDGYVISYKFFIGVPGDAGTDNCILGAGYEPFLPVPCGFGPFEDREHIVNGMNETLSAVCYGSCTDCTDADLDGLLDSEDLCPATADLSLDFDGTNDFVAVDHNAALNVVNADFTFSAWVYVPNDNTYHTIISKGHGGTAAITDYIFNVSSLLDNQGAIGMYLSGEWQYGNSMVPRDEWVHVGVGFDWATKTATFYLNGINDGTDQYESSPFANTDDNALYLGQQGYGCACNHMTGRMDDLQIWNKALSQNEINQYMGQRLDNDETNLVLNFQFDNSNTMACGDNASQTTTFDAGTLGLNGVLNNFSLSGCPSNYASGRNLDSDGDGIGDACDFECPSALVLAGYQTVDAFYQTSGSVQSIQVLSAPAVISYHSVNEIDLQPQFEVGLGTIFIAELDGCN